MARIVIDGLNEIVVERLRAQAERNGRSLEGEARKILESSARMSHAEFRQVAEQWSERFAGRTFDDSADLIREDRQR